MSRKQNSVERWVDVEGYEGLYQVSTFGQVRALEKIDGNGNKRKPKMLKPVSTSDNYKKVRLYKNGSKTWFPVHRLVANAFIPNCFNKPQINHIDENPTNNRVENLEWVTAKENANWGTRTLKQAISASMPVEQFTCDGTYIAGFWGVREAGRVTGLDSSSIAKCCRGEMKFYKGFIWRYRKCDI